MFLRGSTALCSTLSDFLSKLRREVVSGSQLASHLPGVFQQCFGTRRREVQTERHTAAGDHFGPLSPKLNLSQGHKPNQGHHLMVLEWLFDRMNSWVHLSFLLLHASFVSWRYETTLICSIVAMQPQRCSRIFGVIDPSCEEKSDIRAHSN